MFRDRESVQDNFDVTNVCDAVMSTTVDKCHFYHVNHRLIY